MHSSANGLPTPETGDQTTLVMGAGPGGLCSAYVLSKAGVPATVVERAPFVGGLARTITRDTEYGEFKFDIGGHRWFTKNDELNELFQGSRRRRAALGQPDQPDLLRWQVRRLSAEDQQRPEGGRAGQRRRGRWPTTARTRVKQRVRPTTVVSMEDAYIDQFGPTLYKLFFQRYSEKVWGLPCDQMSGDWVTQRSKGMSLVTAVKDAVVPSKGQGRQPDRRVHVPAVRLRPLLGADGRRHHRDGQRGPARRRGDKVHREGNRVTGVTVEHRERPGARRGRRTSSPRSR